MLVRPLPSYGCLSCGFRCFSSLMIQLHWRHWHHAFIAPTPVLLATAAATAAATTTAKMTTPAPPPSPGLFKFQSEMSQLASSPQSEAVNNMRHLESLIRPSVIVKSNKLLDTCPTPAAITKPTTNTKVKGKSDCSNTRHWLVSTIYFL